MLSDIPIPIGGGLETGYPDGMHAILCSWFDVVKVLPLHEVERAAAVEMISYGYPFVRVRWVFDLTVRFTNRTSDPCGGFLGGIVKRPEELAVCVDAVSGLIKNSSR